MAATQLSFPPKRILKVDRAVLAAAAAAVVVQSSVKAGQSIWMEQIVSDGGLTARAATERKAVKALMDGS